MCRSCYCAFVSRPDEMAFFGISCCCRFLFLFFIAIFSVCCVLVASLARVCLCACLPSCVHAHFGFRRVGTYYLFPCPTSSVHQSNSCLFLCYASKFGTATGFSLCACFYRHGKQPIKATTVDINAVDIAPLRSVVHTHTLCNQINQRCTQQCGRRSGKRQRN